MRERLRPLLLAVCVCLMGTGRLWALEPNGEGVYEIGSAEDLLGFAALVTAGNYNINACLTADIDMSRVKNFTPISPSTDNSTAYRGTFDGQGHTITHLTIHTGEDLVGYVGMFSCVCGALLQNIYMTNVCITTDSSTPVATGALVGRNSSSVINNVAVVGVTLNLKVAGEADKSCGGVIGYTSSNVKSFVTNCFTDFETWGNYGSKATITNCFAGQNVAEMAPKGALCYKLNEGQLSTVWYQTLGKDPYPVFDSSHKQVYGAGKMRCDGTLLEGSLSYSNNPNASGRAPHDYDHGICMHCGFCNPDYKELINNAYELEDAQDVLWFSTLVNNGMRTVNARLTADIDMSGTNGRFMPIGTTKAPYSGTFEGNYHTVSNLNVDMEDAAFVGFIGTAGSGMTLKNITFDSSCSFRGDQYVAPVGGSLSAQTGDVRLTNVGNEGTVYAVSSEAGGIIGHNQSSSATFHISNCYSTGSIGGAKHNAAIASWMGKKGKGTVVGCWSTAEVTNPMSQEQYLYRFDGADVVHERLYATKGNQGNIVTDKQMESGEVCWLLNGSTIYAAHWYQTIGEDNYPRPIADRGLVYKYNDQYYSVSDGGEDFQLFRKRMIESGDYLSVIEENRYDTVRAQRNWITLAAVLTILLLAISIGAILSVRRRGRQLLAARQETLRNNQQLQKANTELVLARQQLSESNAIKNEYIGRLFYAHSEFVAKMEKLSRTIQNIIKTKQTNNIGRILSQDVLMTDRGQMYAAFDEAFLRLFPDFVENFNQLFPPEERHYPDSPNSLTSEMRIFALIRLGITDNDRISHFLNYSLYTVKTYKTRVKNRSLIPNEEFEARVMSL